MLDLIKKYNNISKKKMLMYILCTNVPFCHNKIIALARNRTRTVWKHLLFDSISQKTSALTLKVFKWVLRPYFITFCVCACRHTLRLSSPKQGINPIFHHNSYVCDKRTLNLKVYKWVFYPHISL